MKYRLHFLSGTLKGRRLQIGEGAVVLGRDPDCQIQVPDDPDVSRKHAMLETRGSGVFIRDLGELMGVAVNGTPVNEAELKDQDVVTLGRTQFQYLAPVAAPTGSRRRVSPLEVLTLAVLLALFVGQLVFMVWIGTWGGSLLRPDTVRLATDAERMAVAEAEGRASALSPTGGVEVSESAEEEDNPFDLEEVARMSAEFATGTSGATSVTQAVETKPPPAAGEPAGEQVASEQGAPAPVAEVVPVESLPEVDPVVVRAKAMLVHALQLIGDGELEAADQELERIEIMAPRYRASYVERARLFDHREMPEKALAQWDEVIHLAHDDPALQEEALSEKARLTHVVAALRSKKTRHRRRTATGAAGLPRRIGIVNIEREKYQSGTEYDEMRLVRVELKPRSRTRRVDGSKAEVVVRFFDKEKDTGRVVLTRTIVPEAAIALEAGPWPVSEARTVTAAYIVPKGFREEEEQEYGEAMNYYGYVAQVYYDGELQDEQARPKLLFAELD